VTIDVTNIDPAPQDDAYSTRANAALSVSALAGLLANDADADGDALSVTSIEAPSNGTINIATDGSFEYTPDAGFVGQEVLTYTVTDGVTFATAEVTIDVTSPGNAAPTPAPDAFAIAEDAALSRDLFADNGSGPDSDPDGDPLVVTSVNGAAVSVGSQITLASGALLTVNADGTFAYDQNGVFEALNAGETGVDGFEYTVSDGRGGSASASAVITVAGETDLNLVLGTEGNDRLTGTDGADLIRSLGGRSDVATGLGGADVFDFSDSTANGARETRTILDYVAGEDSIALGAAAVVSSTERAGLVTLFLDGDRDVIMVRGVDSLADIDFA